jgi:uncharacterized protein (DUF2336 family)
MESATLELLAELDTTDGWPAERWAAILDRTAKFFLSSAEKLSAPQIDLFDGVVCRLADRVDTPALARLSQKLSETKYSLPQVTRRLALDASESVWAPILKSAGIPHDVLLEVARSCGPAHHLAIASRQAIDAKLSEALIQGGGLAVYHALAENKGARMSEAGWARLAELGQSDPKLGAKLARRNDIPSSIKRELHTRLEDAQMRMLNAKPRILRDQIEDTVASNAATKMPEPQPADLARAQARMQELSRQGKLRDSAVNRFAAAREYVDVAAALALLTGSPIDVIRSLIAGDKVEGLVLACKAARLTWGTTITVVKNRPGMPPVPDEELQKAKETFMSLSLSAAQRTVRF